MADRVYNPTDNRVAVDRFGHGLDPRCWGKVDLRDPVTARLLRAGVLLAAKPAPAPPPPTEPEPAPTAETSTDDDPPAKKRASKKEHN